MFSFMYNVNRDCIPNHERLIVFNGVEQPQRREIKYSGASLVNGNLMAIRRLHIQDCSLRDVCKIGRDKEETKRREREKKRAEIRRI